MVTRVDKLPDEYYHCTFLGEPGNVWLSKGGYGILHLGTVRKPEEPRYHHFVKLYNGEDIEARKATDTEIDWLVRSLAIGEVAPKILELNYQIF